MIELTFLRELMLTRQTNLKSAAFVIIGIFKIKDLNFNQSCVCNRCHDLVMIPMNLSNIAILIRKKANYCFIISEINKN